MIIKYYQPFIQCLILFIFSSYAPQVQAQSCKAKSFEAFFRNFTESLEMQQVCTRFPLETLTLVETQDDLSPKTQRLFSNQIHYPLILNIKSRQEQNISLKIQIINENKVKVTLYKPDSSYQIKYQFLKQSNWQLIKIEDWSV